MPRGKSAKSRWLDVAKEMPPLSPYGKDSNNFDVMDCPVIDWLIAQPDIRQYIINRIRANPDYIFADHKTGKWQGVDYED